MLVKQINQYSLIKIFFQTLGAVLLLLLVFAGNAQAQIEAKKGQIPLMQEYRGIKLGMMAQEVRDKLGKAACDDKDGFYYMISDTESVQIVVNAETKVTAISITYDSAFPNPPKFEDVFGKDFEPVLRDNGSTYLMVRYLDLGYWVSYNRMAGDKPIVTVTMQRIK
jgi:hypothetical protein